VIGHFFAAIGLRPPLPLLRFVLSTLTIIAALLRFGGIVAALATKNDTVATKLLPYYPRYLLAADAMRALQDMNLPIREGNVTTMVAVVSIDEPNWGSCWILSSPRPRPENQNVPRLSFSSLSLNRPPLSLLQRR
jgi:hypothetical protein